MRKVDADVPDEFHSDDLTEAGSPARKRTRIPGFSWRVKVWPWSEFVGDLPLKTSMPAWNFPMPMPVIDVNKDHCLN
jgi:hypothetical protein